MSPQPGNPLVESRRLQRITLHLHLSLIGTHFRHPNFRGNGLSHQTQARRMALPVAQQTTAELRQNLFALLQLHLTRLQFLHQAGFGRQDTGLLTLQCGLQALSFLGMAVQGFPKCGAVRPQ